MTDNNTDDTDGSEINFSSFSIESMPDDDAMTTSQYAQVVFHDIADSYPNDSDLVCQFSAAASYSDEVPISNGDRIGLYKVPFVSPHEYICAQWVVVNKDQTEKLEVVFKASELPKEDDFFQFQFLRANNSVLGASVPFQLRKPQSEELCSVESEDFMVVQTSTALATNHLNDKIDSLIKEKVDLSDKLKGVEEKYSDLLKLCEKQTEELRLKTESFVALDEKCKSLIQDRDNYEQLKTDLVCVLQDKLHLEEKLYRSEKLAKHMERDYMSLKARRENSPDNKEEIQQRLAQKVEDVHATFLTLSKPLELTINEIRETLRGERDDRNLELAAKIDHLDKILQGLKASVESIKEYHAQFAKSQDDSSGLKKELNTERQTVNTLKMTLESLASKHQDLEQKLEKQKKESNLQQQNSEFQIEKLKNELEIKENDNALLKNRVDILNRYEKEEKPQSNNDNADYQSLYEEGKSHILILESKISDLQKDLKSLDESHSSDIGKLQYEVFCLKTMDERKSLYTSTATSTENLNSTIIEQAIAKAEETKEDLLMASSGTEDAKQFPPLEPEQQAVVTTQPSASSHCVQTSQVSSSPPVISRSPLNVANRILGIIPLISESVFGPRHHYHHHHHQQQQEQQQEEEEQNDDPDLMDLANWASNSEEAPASQKETDVTTTTTTTTDGADQSEISTSVTLTDDGRIIVADEEDDIRCPFCETPYEKSQIRELEFHVETHLHTTLNCPVCEKKFPLASQREFEEHVDSHFVADNLDEFVEVQAPTEADMTSRPTAPPPVRGAFFDWDLNID